MGAQAKIEVAKGAKKVDTESEAQGGSEAAETNRTGVATGGRAVAVGPGWPVAVPVLGERRDSTAAPVQRERRDSRRTKRRHQ